MAETEGKTRGVMRRLRKFAAPKDRAQLRDMLKHAAEHGLLDSEALSMLEGVLDVADQQVRDIMVPHNQMIVVREDDVAQRILSVAIDSGHSRFPVLQAEGEKIVGILLAKDLLRLFAGGNTAHFDLRDWMRKPLFVPESKRVNVLLKELRAGRNHMAIAVDEYGSVAGLVTLEDVIEQIVGEIDDEYDVEDEKNIRREDERHFVVRGSTRILDFNEHFGAALPDDDNDTVAGLVTQQRCRGGFGSQWLKFWRLRPRSCVTGCQLQQGGCHASACSPRVPCSHSPLRRTTCGGWRY